jgi:phosphate transport system ATP-binding protein
MSKDDHGDINLSKPICRDGLCIMPDAPFIEATGVSVKFGDRAVLQNVHFTSDACSITALIGPSGCGKTTFLSCFNRLNDLTPHCTVKGTIKIAGQDIYDKKTDPRMLRKKVGMIFQKPNPFPLSIWKNIALPLKQHGEFTHSEIDELVERALKDVGLWPEVKDRLHSPALALSGGQQQRLCIARAIALKPEILLFDEPCSALDPAASGCVEELISSLRKHYTVLIVTHNLAQARRIADRTGVFWTKDGVGQLVELGKTEQIFLAPVHPQTVAYVSGMRG